MNGIKMRTFNKFVFLLFLFSICLKNSIWVRTNKGWIGLSKNESYEPEGELAFCDECGSGVVYCERCECYHHVDSVGAECKYWHKPIKELKKVEDLPIIDKGKNNIT